MEKKFPVDYRGFYVDVGTNDPIRFNNTYKFYKQGWRGINIEPDINAYKKIKKIRSKDININIGIDEAKGEIEYYYFVPNTLNTFSKIEADNYISQGYKLIKTEKILVRRLEDVLNQYLPAGVQIDFMSIDTEGFDINVLNSMNISKFKPKFICIECVKHSISGSVITNSVQEVLEQYGYSKIYTNGINSIYQISRN